VTADGLLVFYAVVVVALSYALTWWWGAEHGRGERCRRCGAKRDDSD